MANYQNPILKENVQGGHWTAKDEIAKEALTEVMKQYQNHQGDYNDVIARQCYSIAEAFLKERENRHGTQY